MLDENVTPAEPQANHKSGLGIFLMRSATMGMTLTAAYFGFKDFSNPWAAFVAGAAVWAATGVLTDLAINWWWRNR